MLSDFLIFISVIVIIISLIAIRWGLQLLEQKGYKDAVQKNDRFMHLMFRILDYLTRRRLKKVFSGTFLAIVLLLSSVILYVYFQLPNVPPVPQISIDHQDTVLLKRGKYLVQHIAHCVGCHSPRDLTIYSMPEIDSLLGAGAPLGNLYAPNITPAHIGNWTDGELYRLLTTGIRKDGSSVNHEMPFERFSKADPQDIKSIIVYIRTLKPIYNKPSGVSKVSFLHNLYNRTIPRKAESVYLKNLRTAADSGRYLITMIGCDDCHTPKKWNDEIFDNNFRLSGGIEFPLPAGGFVHSHNLTPDESGLADWSEETFVNRFKSFNDSGALYKVAHNSLNTPMSWSSYRNISEQDLKRIYAYLRTLKPIYNPVTKFTKEKVKRKKALQL